LPRSSTARRSLIISSLQCLRLTATDGMRILQPSCRPMTMSSPRRLRIWWREPLRWASEMRRKSGSLGRDMSPSNNSGCPGRNRNGAGTASRVGSLSPLPHGRGEDEITCRTESLAGAGHDVQVDVLPGLERLVDRLHHHVDRLAVRRFAELVVHAD